MSNATRERLIIFTRYPEPGKTKTRLISRLGPQDSSWQSIGLRQGLSALDISTVTYSPPFLFFGTLGSGVSVLDESLVLEGS